MHTTPATRPPHSPRPRFLALAVPAIAATLAAVAPTLADDISAPVTLQDFENSYSGIENRMADIFAAGYGNIYTPPPGRADSGNQSVGYDQYNRFDLGSSGNPTLYGTETGLRNTINVAHTAGLSYGLDLVWNQSGFSNTGNSGFTNAGGYPGFVLKLQTTDPNSYGYNTKGYNDADGDYHSAFATGDQNERLAGLIDIAQEKNYVFIRQPTTSDPNNIPAGTSVNKPDPNNARFYPDKSQNPIIVFDPLTGTQGIKIYPFNNANPMAGTPVAENALGLLMRSTQYYVQSLGVDFFRLDATKNYPTSVEGYFDRATYRSSFRTNLDGSQYNVWAFGEYYDGNSTNLQNAGVVRKDIDPNDPGKVGGNRDTLDFPLFFALRSNLSSNGTANNWNNIVNASFDVNDDGKQNGSQGVKFVSSPDDFGPDLSSVAYAYTLMMPGNALVYYNPHQFGTNRDFPKEGRGDAIGGVYGNEITTLVDLRNRFGRGNYHTKFIEKENMAFEREGSALVLLSNRGDSGYDERTVPTDFAPGTYLTELTGNASNAIDDPHDDIPQILQVNADKTVNVRFLRNKAPGTGTYTGDGYLVYGLPTPQGNLTLSNVNSTLAGWDKNTSGMTADQKAFANATNRVANVSVIKSDNFSITLKTNKVNLVGTIRDHFADGDNALLKIDSGIDVNGNGTVDFRDSSLAKSYEYGYEQFKTVNVDGFHNTAGDNAGTFTQNIDTSKLSEGYHYLSVIAFRDRNAADGGDGGPAVFTDWKQTIYVDRLPPTVQRFSDVSFDGNSADRDFTFQSTDKTATDVHTFLNLPASLTDAQILAMVSGNNSSSQTDRDLFKRGFFGIPSGNNVITSVTYEITGNYSIQRHTGISLTTSVGKGLGDIDHNNAYSANDVTNATGCFEALLYPNAQGATNTQFNPSADLNGDGKIDDQDLFLLPAVYKAAGAAAAQQAANEAILRRANINGQFGTDSYDITALYQQIGQPYTWNADLNSDGVVDQADIDTIVHTVFNTEYGDSNLDGSINALDFNALSSNFGRSGQAWAQGDFNGDGSIDTLDFTTMAQHFGFKATPTDALGLSLGANVPEPASIGMILGVSLLPMRRVRRARHRGGSQMSS